MRKFAVDKHLDRTLLAVRMRARLLDVGRVCGLGFGKAVCGERSSVCSTDGPGLV